MFGVNLYVLVASANAYVCIRIELKEVMEDAAGEEYNDD